ncbi:MAG: hypothetical protein VYC39_02100 [Myxococcota bacterium]|nr:hypothetical protein [Myxococcota bacterium]
MVGTQTATGTVAVLMEVRRLQQLRARRLQRPKARRVNRLIPAHPAAKLIALANNASGLE